MSPNDLGTPERWTGAHDAPQFPPHRRNSHAGQRAGRLWRRHSPRSARRWCCRCSNHLGASRVAGRHRPVPGWAMVLPARARHRDRQLRRRLGQAEQRHRNVRARCPGAAEDPDGDRDQGRREHHPVQLAADDLRQRPARCQRYCWRPRERRRQAICPPAHSRWSSTANGSACRSASTTGSSTIARTGSRKRASIPSPRHLGGGAGGWRRSSRPKAGPSASRMSDQAGW